MTTVNQPHVSGLLHVFSPSICSVRVSTHDSRQVFLLLVSSSDSCYATTIGRERLRFPCFSVAVPVGNHARFVLFPDMSLNMEGRSATYTDVELYFFLQRALQPYVRVLDQDHEF